MSKIAFWFALGLGAVTLTAGIIVAKAQVDTNIWYAWVLKSPFVVPSLFFISALFFFVALREWPPFRHYFWIVSAWLVPAELGKGATNEPLGELQNKPSDHGQELLRGETPAQQVWKLEDDAREIKRRWPEADFVHLPASMPSWRPDVNSNAPSPLWVSSAHQWHRAFHALLQPLGVPDMLLNSLDFDGIMELLGDIGRTGQPARIALPSNAPIVKAYGYGAFDKSDANRYRFGLVVQNQGADTAYEIRLQPLRMSEGILISPTPKNMLLRTDPQAFLDTQITNTEGKGIILGNNLASHLRPLRKSLTNGYHLNPILTVLYEDGKGYSYLSRHWLEIGNEEAGPIQVRYINSERLTVPQR